MQHSKFTIARNTFQIYLILIDKWFTNLLRPLYSRHMAKSRHHHHLHHSMAKHHNHNPRSLKLGDGYSRTIHCPNTVLKRNFRARYRITRQFNPRRPCSSRSHWPSIDNELCPLDTWVSSTMKTAEVRVAS